jgi:hypothetical protein
MDKRMYTDTANKAMESRNGILQPQAAKSASGMELLVPKITTKDKNKPKVAVV